MSSHLDWALTILAGSAAFWFFTAALDIYRRADNG